MRHKVAGYKLKRPVDSRNALLRNLGASIGIAVLVSLLARNTQANRSGLVEALTPFGPGWPFGATMPDASSQMPMPPWRSKPLNSARPAKWNTSATRPSGWKATTRCRASGVKK